MSHELLWRSWNPAKLRTLPPTRGSCSGKSLDLMFTVLDPMTMLGIKPTGRLRVFVMVNFSGEEELLGAMVHEERSEREVLVLPCLLLPWHGRTCVRCAHNQSHTGLRGWFNFWCSWLRRGASFSGPRFRAPRCV